MDRSLKYTLELLEDDIKDLPTWPRFTFTAEQFSHSITNVLVEGLRKLGIGEPDPEVRKYMIHKDLAYKLGHIFGFFILLITPIWAPIVPLVLVLGIMYKPFKEKFLS